MTSFLFAEKTFTPAVCELRTKAGSITLRSKTAQLLELFLNHPNQVLEREYLLERIWSEVHVGDHVLSETMRELRAELKDNARRPQFIKTIPKRGYQWIYPNVVKTGDPQLLQAPPQNRLGAVAEEKAQPFKRKPWLLGMASLLTVGLLVVAFAYQRSVADETATEATLVDRPQAITATKRLAIAPFSDGKPDTTWFDSGLHDLLIVSLSGQSALDIPGAANMKAHLKRWHAQGKDWDEVSFANAGGFTDVLQLQLPESPDAGSFSYRLHDGAGNLRQKGALTGANAADGAMNLAGILNREYRVKNGVLPLFDKLHQTPELQKAFARGAQYASSGLPQQAAEQFQFCLNLMPDFHWARYKLANAKLKLGETQVAQETYDHLLKRDDLSIRLRSHILNAQAAAWLRQGALQQAEAGFAQAAKAFKQAGNKESHLKALGNQAVANVFTRKTDRAIDLITQGLALAQQSGIQSQQAQFLSRLAGLQTMANNFEESVETLNKALVLYRQMGDMSGVAEINSNLGMVLLEQGQFQEAEPYFQLAWDQYQTLNMPVQAALAKHNMGSVAFEEERLPKALQLTQAALNMRANHQDTMGLVESHGQLAMIAAAMVNDTQGKQALAMAIKLGNDVKRPDIATAFGQRIMLQLLKAQQPERASAYGALLPSNLPGVTNLELLLYMASEAQNNNQLDQAERLLQRAVVESPYAKWPEHYQRQFSEPKNN